MSETTNMTFIREATCSGIAYHIGDTLDATSAAAAELVRIGFAVPTSVAETRRKAEADLAAAIEKLQNDALRVDVPEPAKIVETAPLKGTPSKDPVKVT